MPKNCLSLSEEGGWVEDHRHLMVHTELRGMCGCLYNVIGDIDWNTGLLVMTLPWITTTVIPRPSLFWVILGVETVERWWVLVAFETRSQDKDIVQISMLLPMWTQCGPWMNVHSFRRSNRLLSSSSFELSWQIWRRVWAEEESLSCASSHCN